MEAKHVFENEKNCVNIKKGNGEKGIGYAQERLERKLKGVF